MTVPNPSVLGGIANSTSTDIGTRANPTAAYLSAPIGGTLLPTTINSGGAQVKIVNPAGPFTPLTGAPTNPLVPPVPNPLPRLRIEGRANTSVYFNNVLVPVHQDNIVADGASPAGLPLTGATEYPTIIIGSQTFTPD